MHQYRQIKIRDAMALKLPEAEFGFYDDYGSGIWLFEDDVCIRFIGEDGGEQEDACLDRDYKWVAKELNLAYELGYKKAQLEMCKVIANEIKKYSGVMNEIRSNDETRLASS